jgi:cytochrome b561
MEAQTKPDVQSVSDLVYSTTARALHWITVVIIAAQIPLGVYMVRRGNATNFDATTNTLYSTHKLIGFCLLWLVVIRLLYRLGRGAPADEPTILWWHKAGAHLTHWGLYALLLVVPVLGWLGVTHYGALGTLGGLSLPAVPGSDALYDIAVRVGSLLGLTVPPPAAPGADKATLVFQLHLWGAMLMVAAILAHVGAAIYHHFIRGDGVLRRMLPGLSKRS